MFVGEHVMEFRDVAGWTKPDNRTVTLRRGSDDPRNSSLCSANRFSAGDHHSSGGDRCAGAQWRRVGTSTWQDSGTTETGIPVGEHAVEFKEVSGWTKPGESAGHNH